MAADDQIPNQGNFLDAQNYEIDINKVYSDFIESIDEVRSTNNANSIRDVTVKNALKNVKSITDIRSILSRKCDTNINLQESRCHAFFRIIGLPCCDSSKSKIFNPGHDILLDSSRKVNDEYKLGIIKDQIPKFRDLSIAREQFTSDVFNIFSAPNSIDAGTLCLSSGRHIRNFIEPLKNTEFDDMAIESQQYKMPSMINSVGGIDKLLTEYQDVNGDPPAKLSGFKFRHIIKPFLVDPVIDLTVNEGSKLIAIPFLPEKKYLKIKDETYVKRPMLEQIIRDRYTINNSIQTSSNLDKSVIDYIKSIPNVTDINLINNAENIYKLGDQAQFIKFLNIIRAMIKKLVEAQHDIHYAQDNYYWVPVPSTNGPENGISVQGVFLSTKISSEFITSYDKEIIDATLKKIVAQANAAVASANSTPDVGGFALPNALGLPNLGGSSSPDALGDSISKNLDQLIANRSSILTKANNALRTIEIIMGEFSGFGLCDIVAILGGLYLMKRESLLGFLDDDALARMNAAGLSGSISSITAASNDFISVVKDLYNLMDKIYQDMSQNNGIA